MGDDNLIALDEGETVTTGGARKTTYVCVRKLGEGGFGAVYSVRDADTDMLYAMKTESLAEKCKVLKMEILVLKALEQAGSRHFCAIVARGRNDRFNYVVMTLVGKSVSDLRRDLLPPYKFTLSTAIRVGLQCLQALEEMHKIGYIHRDIKPANFANGRHEINEHRLIYMLDFGLCRRYRKEDGSLHYPRDRANFRGTTRYAPLNCFLQKELSRKDDLETWLYMLTELTRGYLPWRAMTDKPTVKEAKEFARTEEGKKDMFTDCPRQYAALLEYIDLLKYHSQPDYQFMYAKLHSAMKRNNITDDDPYDWERPDLCASSLKTDGN